LEFEQTFLFDDTDNVVASQRHPLANRDHVPFAALRDYPWIISARVPELRQLLWRKFRECGVPPPEQVVLSDSVQLAKRLLEAQDYLVILGREFIKYEEANGVLCALSVDDFTPRRSVYLSRRRGFELDGPSCAFFDLLANLGKQ
jgi:DNA-binding transcriptional LysR family regulator